VYWDLTKMAIDNNVVEVSIVDGPWTIAG
jgi:hypothetical protein